MFTKAYRKQLKEQKEPLDRELPETERAPVPELRGKAAVDKGHERERGKPDNPATAGAEHSAEKRGRKLT